MRHHDDLGSLSRWLDSSDETGGRWIGVNIDGPDGPTVSLVVVASWGLGWDHVSVSRYSRITGGNLVPPSWNDMEGVKRAFFWPHEAAFQIHPPLSAYVNCHPGVLHMWRSQAAEIELPPCCLIA